jgi:predicted transcriptional regulator
MANYQNNLNMFEEEKNILPEQKLWRAVLCQALYDALSDFKNQMLIEDDRQDARYWFRDKPRSFHEVCRNAGFDPNYVHQKVKKLMNLKNLNKLGIVWNYERKNKDYRQEEYNYER